MQGNSSACGDRIISLLQKEFFFPQENNLLRVAKMSIFAITCGRKEYWSIFNVLYCFLGWLLVTGISARNRIAYLIIIAISFWDSVNCAYSWYRNTENFALTIFMLRTCHFIPLSAGGFYLKETYQCVADKMNQTNLDFNTVFWFSYLERLHLCDVEIGHTYHVCEKVISRKLLIEIENEWLCKYLWGNNAQ